MKVKISFVLLFNFINLYSQIDQTSSLFKELKTRDSLLFNVGYNTCDLNQFESLLSKDFEFYHDEAGLINSKSAFILSVKKRICNSSLKPSRELVENSLQVYKLEKNGLLYAAIQMGIHRFYSNEINKPKCLTGTAKFTNLWKLENGVWKLSRVFSYDHNENKTDTFNESLIFKDKQTTLKWLNKNNVPALGIGLIKDGKIQFTKVYGELEKGREATDSTLFNVASLTKPITALIVLKLTNAGFWDLDEPLYKYWVDPDVLNDPRALKLTSRHVLSHQTGFPNWRHNNMDGKLTFEFEPGAYYQYSGEGFEYIRKALEKKFNKSLEQLADEFVFKPLKMNNTHFYWDSAIDESRFAKWHRTDGTVYKTYKSQSANAADDLITTIEDYCKFMVHIMDSAGLSKDLYTQMISPQAKVKPNKYFGLGWMVDENIGNGEIAINHGGDDKGVHTIAFILPNSKQGLVLFTNSDSGVEVYIQTILYYLGDLGQGIINVETK